MNAKTASPLCLNQHPHPVPAVPEVAERVPSRHGGLRVAAVVPCAREERDVARLRPVLGAERRPGVLVARALEFRALPGPAFVGGNLDAIYRTFADPGAAAHDERLA